MVLMPTWEEVEEELDDKMVTQPVVEQVMVVEMVVVEIITGVYQLVVEEQMVELELGVKYGL